MVVYTSIAIAYSVQYIPAQYCQYILLFYLLVVNFDQFVHVSSIALLAIAYNVQYTALQECIRCHLAHLTCTVCHYASCKETVFQTVTMVTGTHTPRYPPTEHPVLAFKGAPARFPVIREHRSLHQYLKWSKNMNQQAEDYINTRLHGEPYISVHLRMGSDWVRGCNIAVASYPDSSSHVQKEEMSLGTRLT